MSRLGTVGTQYFDDAGDPLIGGKLWVYETGTTTPKNSYADQELTILNTNPVILTASGRQPNVFFDGLAKVILTGSDDSQIEVKDSVGGTSSGAFNDWSIESFYDANDIVEGSDGYFYKSVAGQNQGIDPTTITNAWIRVQFIEEWSAAISYAIGDIVQSSNSLIYKSLTNGNQGNEPADNAASWGPPTVSDFVGEVRQTADPTTFVAPAYLLCDGSVYNPVTYPLLESVLPKVFKVLPDPAFTNPSGDHNAVSANGIYFAGIGSSNQSAVYKRTGDTFDQIGPTSLSGFSGTYGTDLSTDGTYWASTGQATDDLVIYKNTADVYAKLPNPATMPTATCRAVCFSNDDTYLLASQEATPYIFIYKRTGDTFDILPSIVDDATIGVVYGASFSPDNVYVALITNGSLKILKRSGDVFTILTIVATGLGTGSTVEWSADGAFLVATHASAPFFSLYSRSGDTFTPLASPSPIPTNVRYDANFNSTGDRIAVGGLTAPHTEFYSFDGTSAILELDLDPEIGIGASRGCKFTASDDYLFVSKDISVYHHFLKSSNALPNISIPDDNGLVKSYIKTGE